MRRFGGKVRFGERKKQGLLEPFGLAKPLYRWEK
jgi:hypothetical protein